MVKLFPDNLSVCARTKFTNKKKYRNTKILNKEQDMNNVWHSVKNQLYERQENMTHNKKKNNCHLL